MAVSPVDISGSRHYTRAEPKPAVWKCPACGIENISIPEQGCPSCGAGQPGYKAEPRPSTQTIERVLPSPSYKWVNDRHAASPVPPSPDLVELNQLFFAWLQPLRGKVDDTTEALLFQAFKAGYEVGQGARQIEPLEGTAESRTIVAALTLFIDQVLQHNPDEVRSGEFLSAREAQQVIEKYRKGEGI